MLNPEQQLAANTWKDANCKLMILLGGPGTGKTHWIKEVWTPNTLLCAPTGSAADRLHHSTGKEAHVMAKIDFDSDLIDQYQGCEMVLDESGMCDVDTFERIVFFLQPTKILLVGDTKQLPCINGASILATLMMEPAIPQIRLIKNMRKKNTKDSLAQFIGELGQGKIPLIPARDESLEVIICRDDQEALEAAANRWTKTNGQMLAFRTSDCDTLNRLSENKSSALVDDRSRIGDRIICIRNCYKKQKKTKGMLNKDKGKLQVANGIMGTVISQDLIKYDNGFKDKRLAKRGGGRFQSFFIPARAITTHKSQGGEFEEGILVPAAWCNDMNISLGFTALTRFKRRASIFCTKRTYDLAFGGKFKVEVDQELLSAIQIEKKKRAKCLPIEQ